ncbi:hypothetical protein ORI20_21160 [Mycobacterium sp. CVI_P3]|uniref:FAD-binding protein n=1 Tax=Mycobacterium pinniadriaticum TaxID=2994102 RepID=A0ABT3SI04_9MYCO|nr:hypothetical protein [Mycobacterium pinniadriaticum]MCX2932785.1 hypothetical protein [Mycobacterium pinniadriaticum]MCX2939155.1 hypothetical protein [Mycobacterium pinniadriaticum]
MSIDKEPVEASESHWDDVVDVICAGSGPGVLAHAIRCSGLDLDVEVAVAELAFETTDPDTTDYLRSMTDDLGPATARDLELAVVRARPVTVAKDRRATIEPFFGSRLRDWSARCLTSAFGVIYSQIPDDMTVMCTDSGETIRAGVVDDYHPQTDCPGMELTEWLRVQAHDHGLLGEPGAALQRLVFEEGRVAGAALSTRGGTRLVRATLGVALSIGPAPDSAEWPIGPQLPGGAAQLVEVSRTASRFGRIELLYPA